jgi:hypothetical protein
VAKNITSGNSPGPASQPSTMDKPGKVRGAANGITLSSGAVLVGDRGVILANSAPAAIVPYARLKTGADLSGAKLLTLLATGIALVSPPALSQGAMGPGAPVAAPQPRVVAPTPQAPQAPRAPTIIPGPPAVAPMSGAPQAPKSGTNAGGGGKGAEAATYGDFSDGKRAAPGAGAGNVRQAPFNKSEPVIIYGSGIQAAPGAGGGQQERSRAPLPAGYGYDATGRIVYTGR